MQEDTNIAGAGTIATTANRLSRTSKMISTAGATVYQGTDTVALNNDGGRTETFSSSDTRAYAPGSPGFASSVTQTTSANGLVKSTQATLTGASTSSYAAADTTVLNADGSNAETITDTIGGQAADRVTLSLSANALTKVFTLDENADGTTDLSDTAAYATDGSKSETLTVDNTATGARQQYDVITTSPDGRTTTLSSARNGDANFDHFETTVFTPDGGYTDTNWVTNPTAPSTNPSAPANSMTAAPNYKQTRVQINSGAGQSLIVTGYGPDGTTVQDTSVASVDPTGLKRSTTIQLAGVTPATLTETDATVLNNDGSTTETVKEVGASGVTVFQRTISTTADGRSVTTMVDNDGNGIYEHGDIHVVTATGRQVDTETDYSNTIQGMVLPVSAADGTTSPTLVEAISDDGLIKTATKGDVTATTALFPDANGSYQWTKTTASTSLLSSATHIDANKVDTWTVTTPSVSTTVRLDLGSEQRDLGVAQGIYKAVLGRSIQDGETQKLAAYIQGGVLNQIQLTDDLLASGEYVQKYGTNTKANIIHAYVNLFGHLPSPSDVTNYLALLANKTLGSDQILDALAQKTEDEAQGNGLLELLSDEDTITPTTLSLTSTADQAFMSTGAAYGTYVAGFPAPSTGQASTDSINAFLKLVYSTPQSYTTPANSMGTQVTVGSNNYLLANVAGAEIKATASSYVQIVDFGSGNTLRTGINNNVLLMGGNNDILYGGQGSSVLFAAGSNDQVTTGTGAEQVFVSGQGATVNVTASQATSDVVVTGINAKVINVSGTTTVDVSGSGAQIAGSGAQIKLEGGVNTEISGSGHVITGAGLGTTTLDAGSSQLTSNASSNILINGSGNTVTTDSGSMVSIGANATGGTLTVNNSQITLSTGSAVSVTGNGDIVTQRASSTLTASGQGNFVDVTGTGAMETISNVNLLIDPGMSATVNGASNFTSGSERPFTITPRATSSRSRAPGVPSNNPTATSRSRVSRTQAPCRWPMAI